MSISIIDRAARGRGVMHIAAMPFPTHQGTQAAIGQMLEAETALHPVHLAAYPFGATALRLPDFLRRAKVGVHQGSLYSGPHLAKARLDWQLAKHVRQLSRTLDPTLCVAHHIEALLIARTVTRTSAPLLFIAHTALSDELEWYGTRATRHFKRSLGKAFDHAAAKLPTLTAAISPALQARLERIGGHVVHYLPVPWPVLPSYTQETRERIRQATGCSQEELVLTYVGNLDAYQAVEDLLDVLCRVRKRRSAQLRLVTASDARPLLKQAQRVGVAGAVRIRRLEGEHTRAEEYALTDIALVPRRAPSGLPIKLLDALARGIATVAYRRAAAELPIESAAMLVDDDPGAMANAVLAFNPVARRLMAARGRQYIQENHHADRYRASFRRIAQRAASESENLSRRLRTSPGF